MMITLQQAAEWQNILAFTLQASSTPDDDTNADLADDDDEAYDDEAEDENDLHEIRVGDDIGEPDPEEDDHLPDEELQ